MKRRVAVTGIGAVTPIGSGADGLWCGVRRGRSAVRSVRRFDASPFRSRLAAEIDAFDPLEYLDRRRLRRLDRFSQLAVAASLQAVDDAVLERRGAWSDTAGAYIGSALGGEEQHRAFLEEGVDGVDPSVALAVFAGAAPGNVAIELGLRGPSLANTNSCASGAVAIGEAFRLIREGVAEVMLAGGAEAPLAPLTFGSFALIRAMSTANDSPAGASRPFDRQRDGFVMGEAAAVLVLEELGRARARGVRVYAEITGYAGTNDGHHMFAPRADGREAARSISLALADAGSSAEEIGYVNAHASGTKLGDQAEAIALRRALGCWGSSVPVSGTKGLYGHPLGASPAIETAICALALAHGFLPGTANLDEPDPELGLNLVPPGGHHQLVEMVLNTAFGFGGVNAALVLARTA
jgi:3-oxoacyl-[acyl-carrier-protein] synthase II